MLQIPDSDSSLLQGSLKEIDYDLLEWYVEGVLSSRKGRGGAMQIHGHSWSQAKPDSRGAQEHESYHVALPAFCSAPCQPLLGCCQPRGVGVYTPWQSTCPDISNQCSQQLGAPEDRSEQDANSLHYNRPYSGMHFFHRWAKCKESHHAHVTEATRQETVTLGTDVMVIHVIPLPYHVFFWGSRKQRKNIVFQAVVFHSHSVSF